MKIAKLKSFENLQKQYDCVTENIWGKFMKMK